jgi:hypothetical protein
VRQFSTPVKCYVEIALSLLASGLGSATVV